MTIYDAAMAIVVVAGMIRGAWMGITWQLASMASLVLGYVVSHQASAQFAPYFPGEPEVARALAMGAIYILVSGGIYFLARLVRGVLHKLKFEAYDRHLGMLLGGGEAVCVGMLLTMFVVSLAPTTREPIFASPTGKMVGTVMNQPRPCPSPGSPQGARAHLGRHLFRTRRRRDPDTRSSCRRQGHGGGDEGGSGGQLGSPAPARGPGREPAFAGCLAGPASPRGSAGQ